MVKFVRDLSPAEKLEIYKKVKGLCIWNGFYTMPTMKEVLDNKVKDVLPLVDYEMAVDYSYGRY